MDAFEQHGQLGLALDGPGAAAVVIDQGWYLGDELIVPVFAGLPHGIDNWPGNTRFFQQVLQAESTCRDTATNTCERLQVPLRINPVLFRQYGVTEVPTLVYDNGSRTWSVQGEAQLAVLLERMNTAANSPVLDSLIASLRGGQ